MASKRVMRLGVQDDGAVINDPLEAVARARALHPRNYRVIVRGTRGLDAYDAAIRGLHASGIPVQVTLTDYTDPHFVDQAMEKWGNMVHVWSPWNEPDLGHLSTQKYRQLFRHMRIAAAKTGQKKAKFLEGEVSPLKEGVQFARQLGRLKGASGLAVHPYDSQAAFVGSVGHLGKYRTHKYRKLPIYVTEFGEPGALNQGEAAQRLRQAINVARKQGAREFIAYHVSPKDPTSAWDTGLMNPDGTIRPAYRVMRAAISRQNRLLDRRRALTAMRQKR